MKRSRSVFGLGLFLILQLSALLSSERLIFTTSYPSPAGIYLTLLTTRGAVLARDGGRVGIGTAVPAATLDVRGAPGALPALEVRGAVRVMGAFQGMAADTAHQAPSDGFVVVRLGCSGGLGRVRAYGFVGPADPPADRIAAGMAQDASPGGAQEIDNSSFMMPVPRGYYWKIGDITQAGPNCRVRSIRWLPLGREP